MFILGGNCNSLALSPTFRFTTKGPNSLWSNLAVGLVVFMFCRLSITLSATFALPCATSSRVLYSGAGNLFLSYHFLWRVCALSKLSLNSCQTDVQSWSNSVLPILSCLRFPASGQLVRGLNP